jgi:hypothetical protein
MENTKDQIRKVALDLFITKGIEKISCYDIALESKIRFSIVEEFYPKKLELVIDIYKKAEGDMFQFVYGELIEIDDFKVLMRKLFHQSVIWALNSPKEHAFMDYIQSQPYIWHNDNELYPSVHPPILARVQQAIEAGIIREYPIDFVIHFMMKMLNACVSYIVALKTVTTEEYEPLIDPMFESCWDALKKA